MRPLLVVLRLAFVAIVLISNVNAYYYDCYGGSGSNYEKGKCHDSQYCATKRVNGGVQRGCADRSQCGGIIECCNTDFCNVGDNDGKPESGAVTSTPPYGDDNDGKPDSGAVTSTPPYGDDNDGKPDSGADNDEKPHSGPSKGAVTSTPLSPLLIAVIFGVITAFGI